MRRAALFVAWLLVASVALAIPVGVIDVFFVPYRLKLAEWPTWKELWHGQEVATLIQATHPHATILRRDPFERVEREAPLLRVFSPWLYASRLMREVADDLRDLVDAGAKLINLSLSFPYRDLDMAEAIQYAESNGTVIVFSAGNDSERGQPRATDYKREWYPDILTVGSLTRNGWMSDFSNDAQLWVWGEAVNPHIVRHETWYLRGLLDETLLAGLTALDERRPDTDLGWPVESLTGTSFAAPQVVGLLAEIVDRLLLTPRQAVKLLTETAGPDRNIEFEDKVALYRQMGFAPGQPTVRIVPDLRTSHGWYAPEPGSRAWRLF